MALVVEDGSNVAGANSYATAAGFSTYYSDRGIIISGATTANIEGWLIRATDFIDQRQGYQGHKTTESQPLQFPRYGLWVDDYAVDSDEIPQVLIDAQYAVAYRLYSGDDINPSQTPTDKGEVISEKVGSLERKYSSSNGKATMRRPYYPEVESLLSRLSVTGGLWITRA